MARRDRRIYHPRTPWKTALTVVLVLALAAVVVAAGIFLGFRKYLVYTSDGVRLDVPWLQEEAGDAADREPESR